MGVGDGVRANSRLVTKRMMHRGLQTLVENNHVGERMLSIHDHLQMVLSFWSVLYGVREKKLCGKIDLDGSQGSSWPLSVGQLVAHLSSFLPKMAVMVLPSQRAFEEWS